MQTRRFDPKRDGEFLFALYASTRQRELADWGLAGPQAEAFLAMQHRCQLASYAQAYPEAERQVVLWNGQAVGYSCVSRRAGVLRLIDVAILPAFQNRGLGCVLICELQRTAREENAEIRLQVRPDNRALRLYERLGFVVQSAAPTALEMVWKPQCGVGDPMRAVHLST